MLRADHSAREQQGVVAVIEDDVSLNHAIVRQLISAGFATRSFTCAGDVLATHGKIADCFVLDVHLPDMSGFQMLHQLGTAPPVVIITAHDDSMHRRAAEDAGAIAYLTKPFSGEALLSAVRSGIAKGASGK